VAAFAHLPLDQKNLTSLPNAAPGPMSTDEHMKIEIGESLLLSWLRHVQHCTVVQSNWKPSPAWEMGCQRVLEDRLDAIRAWASRWPELPILKKGELDQFVRQAEIDLLGTCIRRSDPMPLWFAVESAFHENGLQYGGPPQTIGRVLKKLARAALAIDAYVDVGEAHLIFATPKMGTDLEAELEERISSLEAMLAGGSAPRFHLRLLANQRFADEILRPVLDHADTVADTGELFLRAQQLVRLFDRQPRPAARLARAASRPPTTEERGRIGEHVRATMAELVRAGRLSSETIEKLQDADYCKRTFGLSYPFLKTLDDRRSWRSQRMDGNGYGRYWTVPLRIGNREFLMCNHWFIEQREPFDRWVKDLAIAQDLSRRRTYAG
jgi:hypothetical protein